MKARYLPVLAVLAATAGCAPQAPRSFEDCLLRYLPDTHTERAVPAVIQACRVKFPRPEQPESGLFDDLPAGDATP